MPDRFYPCHCCGFLTLSDPQSGSYEICPVCFWEDDGVQNEDPAYAGGANRVSLLEARCNYIRFGACAKDAAGHVRPPTAAEFPAVPVLFGVEEERAAQIRRGMKVQILALIRAMRAGSVGIAVGSTRISPFVHWLEPGLEEALLSFVGIASEVDDLPIGSERELWNPDALAIKDRQLADYESRIREQTLADCCAVEALLTADLIGSRSQ
jgi:hypothetical protein